MVNSLNFHERYMTTYRDVGSGRAGRAFGLQMCREMLGNFTFSLSQSSAYCIQDANKAILPSQCARLLTPLIYISTSALMPVHPKLSDVC